MEGFCVGLFGFQCCSQVDMALITTLSAGCQVKFMPSDLGEVGSPPLCHEDWGQPEHREVLSVLCACDPFLPPLQMTPSGACRN